MIKSQQGTSIITAILVIAAMVAISLAGYYAYEDNQTGLKPQVAEKPVPKTAPAEANILKVPELGFKLTLPSDLMDLEYVIETTDGTKSALFSTKSLVAAAAGKPTTYAESDCTAKNGPVGVIKRFASDPKQPAFTVATKQIGDFFLILNFVDGGLCSTDAAAQSLQEKQETSFEADFQTAEPL